MKIKFLGTRGNIEPSAPYHSRHSGMLVDNTLLFDVGEKEFLNYNPAAVFITHLHPDHAFFDANGGASIDIPVYAPEASDQCPGIHVMSQAKNVSDYHVIPIPTIHSKYVQSHAYLIQKDKRVLYTGDMVWINKDYHPQLEGLDLVVTDGSFLRKGGMIRRDEEGHIYGHQGIPNLIKLFEQFTDHIIFTHFGSWFYKDMAAARKKIRSLSKKKVEAAYDGWEIDI
jgi:ribonuclease BN (tRNA processing enzyme)